MQKDGATFRDHLQAAARQGNEPEQLKPVECPDCILYLWEWFCGLSGARQMSEFGPGSLSYQEIMAWTNLTGKEIESWEVNALKMIDAVYLKQAYKKGK